jgi:hypothetical protein
MSKDRPNCSGETVETVERFLRLIRVCLDARIPDGLIHYAELN